MKPVSRTSRPRDRFFFIIAKTHKEENSMREGICPKCGSKNVYRSVNNSWSSDGIAVKARGDQVNEVFGTEAFLCVDCRHLEIHVDENSAAFFGKGKPLKDSVAASSNWKKVE
jgi:hypothetical protein